MRQACAVKRKERPFGRSVHLRRTLLWGWLQKLPAKDIRNLNAQGEEVDVTSPRLECNIGTRHHAIPVHASPEDAIHPRVGKLDKVIVSSGAVTVIIT